MRYFLSVTPPEHEKTQRNLSSNHFAPHALALSLLRWYHRRTVRTILLFGSICFCVSLPHFCSLCRDNTNKKLLYPVLMFVMLWRTLQVRVRPNTLVIFRERPPGEAPAGGLGLLARFHTSLRDDSSLFSWADKGQWETVDTTDREVRREGNWFRIGFEPAFVDYTKRGVWFMIVNLVEVRFVFLSCSDISFYKAVVLFFRVLFIHFLTCQEAFQVSIMVHFYFTAFS